MFGCWLLRRMFGCLLLVRVEGRERRGAYLIRRGKKLLFVSGSASMSFYVVLDSYYSHFTSILA